MKKIWNTTTKNWVYGILACMALMITLNADLSSISAEAAQGGFFNVLAMTIKKLEYVLPVFTYRDGLLALLVLFFFQKTTIRQESRHFAMERPDSRRFYCFFPGIWLQLLLYKFLGSDHYGQAASVSGSGYDGGLLCTVCEDLSSCCG